MRKQDKRNLIRSWPVYSLFLMLIAVLAIFYKFNQNRIKNEPLADSIARSFYGAGTNRQFETIDAVINDRKSWHPLLPGWQGKPTNDFSFTTPDEQPHQLNDSAGKQTIVLVWASWYPACKMQLIHLQQALSLTDAPTSVIAVTAETSQTLRDFPAADYPDITFATVSSLPEPFSLPGSVPAVFFLDADHHLTLAAEGLVTANHILAILDLTK